MRSWPFVFYAPMPGAASRKLFLSQTIFRFLEERLCV